MINPTQLLVELAPLDPAFKGTPQQFATHVVQRMRIVSPSGIVSFVVGDVEPRYNAGPWLKGGTAWWVWDETTKRYVPLDITDTAAGQAVLAIQALLARLIDNNGNLLPGTVWNSACLADRIVTQPKLHWNSCFYCSAGGVNAYSVSLANTDGTTPVPSFGDGSASSIALLIKIGITNTTPVTTLSVNGSVPYPLVKDATTPLVAGDLLAGKVYLVVFDGTSFQVLDGINEPLVISMPSATIVDKQNSGTDAQALGAEHVWQDKVLTDVLLDPNNFVISLAANEIELGPGTYDFQIAVSMGQVQGRLRLYDSTLATPIPGSYGAMGGSGNNTAGHLSTFCRVVNTAAVSSKYKLQYYVNFAGSNAFSSMAIALDTGEDEIYALIQIVKIS